MDHYTPQECSARALHHLMNTVEKMNALCGCVGDFPQLTIATYLPGVTGMLQLQVVRMAAHLAKDMAKQATQEYYTYPGRNVTIPPYNEIEVSTSFRTESIENPQGDITVRMYGCPKILLAPFQDSGECTFQFGSGHRQMTVRARGPFEFYDDGTDNRHMVLKPYRDCLAHIRQQLYNEQLEHI